jgi:predicted anti-sigma-YlaC factor YlaD
MDCKHFRNNIFAYQEGLLSAEDLRLAENHLLSCKACEKILADVRVVDEMIHVEKTLEPAPFTSTRILQRIDNEFSETRKPPVITLVRILQPVTLALALVCGILIGSYTARKDSPPAKQASNSTEKLEFLRANLFITDFADEDKNPVTNK